MILATVLYLDVTSSCKSPMNTGVQRVVRSLYRALSAELPVTPLIWDPGLTAYCTLSRRERGFLENPFAAGTAADAEPGRRANPIPLWSKFVRRLTHRRNRLDLPAQLTPADTLFVPEIFQDNRTAWLDALPARTTARRVGLFHDALTYRRPDLTPSARQPGFAEYIDTLGGLDHVITISQQSADDLRTSWRERGRPDDRMPPVSVFGWPVDHGGAKRRVLPPVAGEGVRSGLCVGTFEPRKNHLALLAAAERVWQTGQAFELVLVGRTTANFGEQVEAAVTQAQGAGRAVRWLRHVDDATLRQAYEACAFTVFPSLAEGFGIPILESLWHGRPCVCGGNGALGEVAAGGGCLIVTDQRDPATLAAALERLLTDRETYERLCAEASARPFGSWAGLARELTPILRSERSAS